MSVGHRLASRRRVLRGTAAGAAVTVGLPLLGCFLNGNGTALAADGAPLPVRFFNWFWGLGLTPHLWMPDRKGAGYAMGPELKPLERFSAKMNVYSGFRAILDGNAPVPHSTGYRAVLTGTCAKQEGPSIDSLISRSIGMTTRFQSIEVAATGNPSHTVSRRSATVTNPADASPLALYNRIFGPEFKDPNAAVFAPDRDVMVHKSVLSTIKDQREDLMRDLGMADRARLDEYFTSLRQIEHQLALQLEKPAPLNSCTVPEHMEDAPVGTDIDLVISNHKLMANLLAHAMACDQTRVANIAFTDGPSSLRRAGEAATHHVLTHEEAFDKQLKYQPQVKWFNDKIVEALATLLATLESIREGDRTLLDNSVVFASTESGFAWAHTLDNIPIFTAGSAGGRLKTGLHVAVDGEPVTRVGLTLQQAFGVAVDKWGDGAMSTSKTVTDILA